MMDCPKCEADISDSFQEAEPDVGIMCSGYYCEVCDLPVEGNYDPRSDDVPMPTAAECGIRVTGTPISQLSGQPGKPGYEEFCRIAKSWGYE